MIPILIFKFPSLVYKNTGEEIYFRFWLRLLFLPILIVISLFLDFNPFITLVALISILLFLVARKYGVYWIGLIFITVPLAPDIVDGLSILLWVLCLYFSFNLIKKISRPDLVIVLFLFSLVPQSFSSFAPVFFNFHKGRKLGDGMAYFFCRWPKNGHIYASIPNCPTFKPADKKEFNKCQLGKIVEYDTKLQKVSDHKFFNNDFFGRLEGIICLPDSLIIGVTNLSKGGRFYNSNGLQYFPDKKNTPKLLRSEDELGGNGAIYDPYYNALFTFSEDARKVFRWDLNSNEWDLEIGKYWDVGPLIVGVDGHYPKRKTLFAGEFIGGSKTIEFNLRNFEIINSYKSPDGAVLGITVDSKLDRVIISGFWGFSVTDLKSKKIIKKIRTGFLPRAAVIDEKNNLVFVGSTFDGKIRVFNRENFKLLKTIPVGYGVRYLLVDKTGNNLLYANYKAHFSWPIKLD